MKKTLMFKEDILKYLEKRARDGIYAESGAINDTIKFVSNYQIIPADAVPDHFKQLIKEDRENWLKALETMDLNNEKTNEKIAEILADQDNDVRAVVDVNLQISLRYDQVFELLPKSSELTVLLGILKEDNGTLYQTEAQRSERLVKINALKKILMKLEKDDETRVTNTEYSDFDKEKDDELPSTSQ